MGVLCHTWAAEGAGRLRHVHRTRLALIEDHAADCLRIGEFVLVLDGYPTVKKEIEAEGFETRAVELSEFEKCDGGLTCLSIVF